MFKGIFSFGRSSKKLINTLPAGSFRFVAVDVETANEDVGSICQLGLAMVSENNKIATYTQIIDPQCEFDATNIGIHGIGPKDVKGHPTFPEILPEILPILERNILVQHSSFDSRAFKSAFLSYDLSPPILKWSDSVLIARRAWPELKGNGGHGLANLKKALNLDFEHHDAGEDARAAAMVVLRAETHTGQSFKELATRKTAKNYPPTVKMEGSTNGPLFGQIAVFTGALSISRTDAARFAAQAGITTKATVSKKVTLLVVGDQDLGQLTSGHTKSTKHRRAEELINQGHDIRIIGETEFLTIIKDE